MKKIIALFLALGMLFALAACGGKSADADEPIKIGHIADLTGVESLTGQEADRALRFALEQLGGQIAGRPVEIITEDAQSDSTAAVEAARKLVEKDGVAAILGPTQVGHKSAVAAYIATAGIPAIYYNGTPFDIVDSNEYLISSGGGTAQMPTAMADYLFNELGYRTINTITQENTGGYNYLEPLIAHFEALGGTVLSEQYVPVSTPDFEIYMTALPDADALVAWVSGSDAVSLWTAWYDMGISERMPMHAAMHGGFTDYFICDQLAETKPAVVEAMLKETYAPITYSYTVDTPENNAFVEAWTAEFGAVPLGSNLSGATYSALQLLAAAIESLDGSTNDPSQLRQAILAADITGPEGHLYFDEAQRIATKDVHICKLVRLEDGSFNYEVVKTYKDVPASGLTAG